jgi:hypothetical protein
LLLLASMAVAVPCRRRVRATPCRKTGLSPTSMELCTRWSQPALTDLHILYTWRWLTGMVNLTLLLICDDEHRINSIRLLISHSLWDAGDVLGVDVSQISKVISEGYLAIKI